MADAKKGGKGSKKLGRAARQATKVKGLRSHHIAQARIHHMKNAIRSCGLEFANDLRAYYDRHPISSIGKRAGKHRGSNE